MLNNPNKDEYMSGEQTFWLEVWGILIPGFVVTVTIILTYFLTTTHFYTSRGYTKAVFLGEEYPQWVKLDPQQ